MQAYLGDKELKARLVVEIKKHEKADEIAQGAHEAKSGGKLRLCAVGCSLKSMNVILNKKDESVSLHARYESELGIPQVLARLEDRIFEGLPEKEMKTWPRRFAEAINVGADLSKVWPQLAIWLLTDKDGVMQFAKGNKDIIASLKSVASIYIAERNGKPMTREEINVIRNKVWNVRRAAAYAAAAAAAYAAYAAAAAAAYAAYAAAAAAADARHKFYVLMSKKLLELLKKAK